MRLSRLVGLCLLSTAALAGPPSPEMMKDMINNPWAVEFIGMMGQWSRIGGWPTRAACEAAIQDLPMGQGGDGHCVYNDWSSGRIIGSQDPAWAGSYRWDQWVIEFNAVDGKYRRVGVGFSSKAACESAIPFQLRMQGGYNGHCIEFKDGHYVGSHDPAWAEK
jgi:hypothetical protein